MIINDNAHILTIIKYIEENNNMNSCLNANYDVSPHFVGFDGSSFDFMGDDKSVYNLFSSFNLQINAHFRLSCCPHHYPEYSKPMWMDSIAVMYYGHRFQYDIYNQPNQSPIINEHRLLRSEYPLKFNSTQLGGKPKHL
jgi:hypothetical protein